MKAPTFLFLVVALLFSFAPATAADQAPSPTKRQYLIILRPVVRLHDEKAWTPADNAAVAAHFQRLQQATKTGQVLLAGRTLEPGDRGLGLVIFEAEGEAEAKAFMAADPCVQQGVFTAELRPYYAALVRKN